MTGYFSNLEPHASYRYLLTFDQIRRFLASGKYIIQVWLAKAGFEIVMIVEDAAVLEIAPFDIYGNGIPFAERGFIPLKMNCEVIPQ
jgi:hypothetical protein